MVRVKNVSAMQHFRRCPPVATTSKRMNYMRKLQESSQKETEVQPSTSYHEESNKHVNDWNLMNIQSRTTYYEQANINPKPYKSNFERLIEEKSLEEQKRQQTKFAITQMIARSTITHSIAKMISEVRKTDDKLREKRNQNNQSMQIDPQEPTHHEDERIQKSTECIPSNFECLIKREPQLEPVQNITATEHILPDFADDLAREPEHEIEQKVATPMIEPINFGDLVDDIKSEPEQGCFDPNLLYCFESVLSEPPEQSNEITIPQEDVCENNSNAQLEMHSTSSTESDNEVDAPHVYPPFRPITCKLITEPKTSVFDDLKKKSRTGHLAIAAEVQAALHAEISPSYRTRYGVTNEHRNIKKAHVSLQISRPVKPANRRKNHKHQISLTVDNGDDGKWNIRINSQIRKIPSRRKGRVNNHLCRIVHALDVLKELEFKRLVDIVKCDFNKDDC